MFTKEQKELINDLLDLFAETYKNVAWHQTGIYLNQMCYCNNVKHEVNDFKRFILKLNWDAKHSEQSYIAGKLLHAIKMNCHYNH